MHWGISALCFGLSEPSFYQLLFVTFRSSSSDKKAKKRKKKDAKKKEKKQKKQKKACILSHRVVYSSGPWQGCVFFLGAIYVSFDCKMHGFLMVPACIHGYLQGTHNHIGT